MSLKTSSKTSIYSTPEQILNSLNSAQREAVTQTEGPCLIIAGAGTGKTKVITHRLAYILSSHPELNPSNVLALTYTRKAAEEMATRVEEIMTEVPDLPKVMTFHSFALELIQEHALEIGLSPRMRLVGETLDRAALVQPLLLNLELNHLSRVKKRDELIEPVLKFIERAKDELICPEDYKLYLEQEKKNLQKLAQEELAAKEEELAKNSELAEIYRLYEETLEKEDSMDYGGLIASLVSILKTNPRLSQKILGSYHYILVDEFQDTNIAQIELLHLLAGPHKNLCVVGDDDQAIYRFRGASYASFKKFREMYPDARIVKLTENYRSTKNILRAAGSAIAVNGRDRYEEEKILATQNSAGAKVDIHYFSGYSEESAWIAAEITKLVSEEGPRYSDFAVLIRSHSTGKSIKQAFRREGIPYEEVTGGLLFDESEVRDAIAILKLAAEYDEDISFARILLSPLCGISPKEYRLMADWARREKDGELARYLDEIPDLNFISKETRAKLAEISKKIEVLKKLARRASPGEIFWRAASEFHLFTAYYYRGTSEARAAIRHLASFYEFIQQFEERDSRVTLRKLIHHIALAEKLNLGPSMDPEVSSENAVRLLTVHAAKGLEFPVVFIPALNSRKFPTNRKSDAFPLPEELMKEALPEGDFHIEEERRLFYVALTRAKEKLYLSCIQKKGTPPSQFIKDLLASESKEIITEIHHDETEGISREEQIMKTLPEPPAISLKMLRHLEEKSGDFEKDLGLLISEFLRLRSKDLAGKTEKEIRSLIIRASEKAPAVTPEIPKEETVELLKAEPENNVKMVLSHSKLEAYEWCPLKYQFRFEFNIPTPPAPHLKFGDSVHKALEMFLKAVRDGKTPALEDLMDCYEKTWDRRGYRSKAEEDAYKKRGSEMLRAYFENCSEDMKNKSIFIETKFMLPVSDTVEVNGKIDRVQQTENGEIEVLDYKTGKAKDQDYADESLQLSIYALAIETLLGKKPDRMTFHYLDEGQKVSSEMNAPKADETKARILEIASKIRQGAFQPIEEKHRYIRCKLCEYKPICPVWEK